VEHSACLSATSDRQHVDEAVGRAVKKDAGLAVGSGSDRRRNRVSDKQVGVSRVVVIVDERIGGNSSIRMGRRDDHPRVADIDLVICATQDVERISRRVDLRNVRIGQVERCAQ